MQPTVNLCVRDYNDKLNYKFKEESPHFLEQITVEEVKSLSRRDKKRLLKVYKTTFLTCVSLLVLTTPTFAATEGVSVPKDLMDTVITIQLIAVLIGVGLAKIFLIMAGITRMLRKEKISKEWTVDIIKGLAQVLTAPVIVMLLTFVVNLLFGQSEWFISPS